MRTDSLVAAIIHPPFPIQPAPIENLETMVGVHLLSDLNSQLEDVAQNMEQDLQNKQNLRQEIIQLQTLSTQTETSEIEGKKYRDLTEVQLAQLNYPESAIPLGNTELGENLYRLSEEDFLTAKDAAISGRKETLAQMNSQGEITMIQIQSLVEQRKQALTLLSNLLAASHQVAQTIIGNIRS